MSPAKTDKTDQIAVCGGEVLSGHKEPSIKRVQGALKKWGYKLMTIILSNLNRLKIFFHLKILW